MIKLLKKVFGKLGDGVEQLNALLHSLGPAALVSIQQLQPKTEEQRLEAQAIVLSTVFDTMLGADDAHARVRADLIGRGSGDEVAKGIAAAFVEGDPEKTRAALVALATQLASVTRPSPPSLINRPTTPNSNLPRKEQAVPSITIADFAFDNRNIPDDLKKPEKQAAYVKAVMAALVLRDSAHAIPDPVLVAAVVGGLLRQGQFNAASTSLPQLVAKLANDLLKQQADPSGGENFNALQVFQKIAEIQLQQASSNGNGKGAPAP
jgi:hypothetical protein